MVVEYKNIAVLMGGFSSEREVSLRSGAAVCGGLERAGYRVSACDITSRTWDLPGGTDAAFIALHGTYGEDGELQAELEKRGVPYTGSGPAASRKAFDKLLTRQCLEQSGIPVAPGIVIDKPVAECPLALPVVVKPPRQGSSVGIGRVFAASEWPAAQAAAVQYDKQLLVEKFIAGRELTVGVLLGEALPAVEIVAPDSWYDYNSKYTAGACRYVVPAALDEKTAQRCGGLALETFAALGCRTFGRVDFRLAEDGALYVLEMNTIPGFTETSLLPKAAAAIGIDFAELCDRIVSDAGCWK